MYEFAYNLSLKLRHNRHTWKWIHDEDHEPSTSWVNVVYHENEALEIANVTSFDRYITVFGAVLREDLAAKRRYVLRKGEILLEPRISHG